MAAYRYHGCAFSHEFSAVRGNGFPLVHRGAARPSRSTGGSLFCDGIFRKRHIVPSDAVFRQRDSRRVLTAFAARPDELRFPRPSISPRCLCVMNIYVIKTAVVFPLWVFLVSIFILADQLPVRQRVA